MSPQERESRQKKAEQELLVITRTEDGYRVHSPGGDPTRVYTVTGIADAPECTCPDFQYHRSDPDWACKHILAVMSRRQGKGNEDPGIEIVRVDGDPIPKETAPRKRNQRSKNGVAQMLLKRSVSPDGRIDSLSVEISTSVEMLSESEIKERAEKVLTLQGEIVKGFKGTPVEDNRDQEPQAPGNSDEPVPGTMLDIGGMNGKYGRRLFITVQANGRHLRLFGNRKQLTEHITEAGYPGLAERIEEGTNLNVPCRIVTKPTPDGRYLNVEKVLPAAVEKSSGRGVQ